MMFASAASLAAPAAESPVLQVFRQWLEAFNTGDAARIEAFWKKYDVNPDAARKAGDQRLHHLTGNMKIFRIKEDTGTHLVALMEEARGVYSESTLDLSSTNPPMILRLFGHPVPNPGDVPPPASDDRDLERQVRDHVARMPGPAAFSGAILIAHHGQTVLDQAWGMANTDKQIGNTIDTQFCLGSMNKMFTSVAILQLVGEGKLALDKPMAAYWPDYPNRDLAARVTIRELLSHTGGTGDIFTPEYGAHRLEIRTLADYVKLFGDRPVGFEPGSRMEYSNYGFILLGRIIELVSGEPYEAYVHKHIYVPAGMTRTDSRPEVERVEGRAVGYKRTESGLAPNTDFMPWSGTSAGGGYSTVGDLLRFAEALQDGKLLSPALLKEAITGGAANPEYGLGFYVLPEGAYGHGGGAPGINGELHILPRSGYVLVALVNRDPPMASAMVEFVTSILPQH